MMAYTMSQFDWDEEDVEAYKLSLADYLRSKANAGLLPPAIIPIPWKDNEGRIPILGCQLCISMGYHQ